MTDNQELIEEELDIFDRAYIDDDWEFKIRFNKIAIKPWEVFFHKEKDVVSPCVVASWHTADEAKEYAAAQNRLYLGSFFQEQLAQTQQALDRVKKALKPYHAVEIFNSPEGTKQFRLGYNKAVDDFEAALASIKE